MPTENTLKCYITNQSFNALYVHALSGKRVPLQLFLGRRCVPFGHVKTDCTKPKRNFLGALASLALSSHRKNRKKAPEPNIDHQFFAAKSDISCVHASIWLWPLIFTRHAIIHFNISPPYMNMYPTPQMPTQVRLKSVFKKNYLFFFFSSSPNQKLYLPTVFKYVDVVREFKGYTANINIFK